MKGLKLGFIGCGNMASAIIGGLVAKGLFDGSEMIASAPSEKSRKRAEDAGIKATSDNKEVVNFADVVVLAVKPQMLENVLSDIAADFRKDQIIISIAAGKTLADLAKLFGRDDLKIVRVMPNTPCQVGEGMSAYCGGDAVTAYDLEIVNEIFSACGKASEVSESLFDIVTGVSGSSPAYVFIFIDALANAAVHGGMKWDQAYQFAAQAVLGSAKMVLETGEIPEKLRDMVCSPAGTTIEAVRVLEEKGLRSIIMEAVKACAEKSASM